MSNVESSPHRALGLTPKRGLALISTLGFAASIASCDASSAEDPNDPLLGVGGGAASAGSPPATTNAGNGGALPTAGTSGSTPQGGSSTNGGATSGGSGGASVGPVAGTGAGPSQGGASAGSGGVAVPTVPATCQGTFASADLNGAPHAITVDRASAKGGLPHFWNTYGIGHMAAFLQEDKGWGETLKAHVIDGVQNLGLTSIRAHGLFHDDLGVYREEGEARIYDFTKLDLIFDFLVQQGVEPIIELGSMPAALARDPSQVHFIWKMGISPPKDFALWQELVFKFTEHMVQRYGADVVNKWYFEVWNEPECCNMQFWRGTLEEYFELYDHAVAGVRAALPTGKVGGPVASQPIELTANSEVGRKFLQHVTTNNFVTPGQPGHLDVFMYHSWDFLKGAINGYFTGLELLSSFGLDNVGIAITEFGPTWQFNLMDEPQETEHGAAFVAQTYSDIAQRCAKDNKRFPVTYAWWTLSDIFKESDYREDDPFIGAMGLISRQNIRKPAYNAYKFLAQMGDEQVSLTTNGSPGIGGMAARDANGGVQLIVYNGQSPGGGFVDDKYYTTSDPQDIAVTVSGLDAALPYDVAAYRVDATHGNAYAVWRNKGRPTMTTMTEADWTELRGAMDSKPESTVESQCGGTYTGRFSVASPGVLFVKLTPTPPKPVTATP